MRKLSLALAALATIAVAAPTIASAEDFGVGVRVGGTITAIGASSVNIGNFAVHAQSSVTTTAASIAAGTGTAASGR
jgi:hypothetical protein